MNDLTSTQEAQSSGLESFEFDPTLLERSFEDLDLQSMPEQKITWQSPSDIELESARHIQAGADFQTESDSTRSGPPLKINNLGKVTIHKMSLMTSLKISVTFLSYERSLVPLREHFHNTYCFIGKNS